MNSTNARVRSNRTISMMLGVISFSLGLILLSSTSLGGQPADKSIPEYSYQDVNIRTSDNVKIKGTLYMPKKIAGKVPGILLLHQLGRDRHSWSSLVPLLIKEGYVVLAIDLRGHGESIVFGDTIRRYRQFSNDDYKNMIIDVSSAVKYLKSVKEVKAEKIAIIGASIGANLALQYAARDKEVRTVVLLSPGLNYRSLETLPYLKDYDRRALFIVASEGDVYSANSSKRLREEAKLADPCKLKIYTGSAHGTDLLDEHRGLGSIIVAWLQNHLPNG